MTVRLGFEPVASCLSGKRATNSAIQPGQNANAMEEYTNIRVGLQTFILLYLYSACLQEPSSASYLFNLEDCARVLILFLFMYLSLVTVSVQEIGDRDSPLESYSVSCSRLNAVVLHFFRVRIQLHNLSIYVCVVACPCTSCSSNSFIECQIALSIIEFSCVEFTI